MEQTLSLLHSLNRCDLICGEMEKLFQSEADGKLHKMCEESRMSNWLAEKNVKTIKMDALADRA